MSFSKSSETAHFFYGSNHHATNTDYLHTRIGGINGLTQREYLDVEDLHSSSHKHTYTHTHRYGTRFLEAITMPQTLIIYIHDLWYKWFDTTRTCWCWGPSFIFTPQCLQPVVYVIHICICKYILWCVQSLCWMHTKVHVYEYKMHTKVHVYFSMWAS